MEGEVRRVPSKGMGIVEAATKIQTPEYAASVKKAFAVANQDQGKADGFLVVPVP